jgi:hypothetical protein
MTRGRPLVTTLAIMRLAQRAMALTEVADNLQARIALIPENEPSACHLTDCGNASSGW